MSRGGTARKAAFLLGAICIVLLAGIADLLVDVWRADRAATWPTTRGVVVESTSEGGCGRKRNGYRVFVLYKYRVAGADYHSRRVIFGEPGCLGERDAKARRAEFPFAAPVKVSYDPQNPADAVLTPGRTHRSVAQGIAFMSLWLFIAAMAAAMAAYVARTTSAPPAKPSPE